MAASRALRLAGALPASGLEVHEEVEHERGVDLLELQGARA